MTNTSLPFSTLRILSSETIMDKYRFKTNHSPLQLEQPLYLLAKSRPNDWDLIRSIIELDQDDLTALSKDEKSHDKWLNKIISSWTFGQLLEECLTLLPSSNRLNQVLCDLIEDYAPIKLRPEDLQGRTLKSDLGHDVTFAISAQGSPSLTYHWFFWPTYAQNCKNDWKTLTHIKGKEIQIFDMRLEDVGIYKCLVQHTLSVFDEQGNEAPGVYSGGVEITIDPGSIFITEHPKDTACILLDSVSLMCLAESACQSLSVSWYHNDKLIVGEKSNTLKLTKVTLDHRGAYKCLFKTSTHQLESKVVNLQVDLPTTEQFEELNFDNEDIEIIQQPVLPFANVKAAIGEKVHLTCLAACKYSLKYEWLKRGVRTDLIAKSAEVYLDTELVGLSCQLIDEIQDVHPPVSYYIYQCNVRCLQTGEKLASHSVKVPVSTYTLPDRSLPEFKIALLICQEEYDHNQCFNTLLAPRSDGRAVAKALQEIDFEVMLFSNLTVAEIHHALDIFCSLINEQTYALFYFNGHALGHGNDIYLVGKDTSLDGSTPASQQLVWHGEIEIALDKCRPLFATIIYDSCRDQLPESVRHLVKESSREHEPVHCESNFCIGYGTRQSMRSFVKMDKSGLSQSLYTKYLLQHINTKSISIGTMFERLNCSFTKGEDASIVAQMKPEFKDSTRQSFSLAAPLRHSYAGNLHKKFFKLFRFEALSSSKLFDSQIQVQLGLAWCPDAQVPMWIKGKTFKTPQAFLKLSFEPSMFLNEAYLNISLKCSQSSFWLQESAIQVIPQNVKLSVANSDNQSSSELHYGPYESQDSWDGPVLRLDQFGHSDQFELMSQCHLSSLQCVTDQVLKFRLFLMYQECPIPCKGVINFPVPLCQNVPKLRLNN